MESSQLSQATSHKGLHIRESKLGKNLPGILMVAIIAYIADNIGKDLPLIGGTVIAILLGMLLKNFVGIPAVFNPGVQYSLKKLLKYAIILLGTSMNLSQIFSIGGKSILVIIAVVLLGIGLTMFIGNKLMGLHGNVPILVGIGTAICGATAIASVSPILKSKEEETAIAITTIFMFNVIAVIFYPILGGFFGMSDEFFGIWAGSAIHDTSSVVAAGYAYSDASGGIATVVKLTRTLFLLPIAIILGVIVSIELRKQGTTGSKVNLVKIFPFFLLGFLAMAVLNTLGLFSEKVIENITIVSKFMILMAMASVGLGTDFKKMSQIGLKPVYLGLIASVIVSVISLTIIYIII